MKKITGLILALTMLMSVIGTLGVSAATLSKDAPEMNVNLMKNSGLEEVRENGYPVNVEAYRGWEGGFVTYVTDDTHSGNGAVKVATEEGGHNAWANMQAGGFVGGCTVELSFWYKCEIPDRTGDNARANLGVKFEGYQQGAIRSDWGAGSGEFEVTTESKADWTKASVQYTLDERATMVACYIRLYHMNKGSVIFDDVEIKMVKLPEISFQANTDTIFYYDDIKQTEGYAYVDMNKNFVDEGYTADFAFMDGNAVVEEAKGVKFDENKQAIYTYPLSYLKKLTKEYNIVIKVKEPKGAVIYESTERIFKYKRPNAISKDGVYTDKNGKIVKPIFNYHMSGWDDKESLKNAAEAGINVMQFSAPTNVDNCLQMLDEMYEMGLYAAVVCYWGMYPAGHERNRQQVYDFMMKIKDHPAIFCWMAMDEAFLAGYSNKNNMIESYIMLRSIDDHIPVYSCEAARDFFHIASNVCDIMGPDPYPAQWNSYGTYVPMVVDEAVTEASKRGRMVVGILQSTMVGTLPEYIPTPVQEHSMIMQNYMAGAKGHGWYAWEPDNKIYDVPLDESERWEVMLNYNKLESDHILRYFITGEYTNFNVDKPGDVRMQTGDAWYETWTDGKDVYGIVQNRLGEELETTVSLTSENEAITITDYEFSLVYDGAAEPVVTPGKGEFTVKLQPYHAIMFKIDAKEDINVNLLKSMGDMSEYGWAAEAVNFLYDKGIEDENEDMLFRPGEAITRGEFAKFLIRTLELKTTSLQGNFSDVDKSADYAQEVATGKALGVLNGVGANMYNPESAITRQDLMVICARAMRYFGPVAANNTKLDLFPDNSDIADYAKSDVTAMVELGIIKGNADGTINPLGNTTRAEAAVIMQRIYAWKNA